MERENALRLVRDIQISILNLSEHLTQCEGKSKEELSNLLAEMEMTKAWLIEYHALTSAEISLEA